MVFLVEARYNVVIFDRVDCIFELFSSLFVDDCVVSSELNSTPIPIRLMLHSFLHLGLCVAEVSKIHWLVFEGERIRHVDRVKEGPA